MVEEPIRNKSDLVFWIYNKMIEEKEFKKIVPIGKRDLEVETTKGNFRVRVSAK